MGRPPNEVSAPSQLAPAIVRYVRSRGGDAVALAHQCGLEHDVAERDEVPLTSSGFNALIAAASEILAEPFLALRLPAEIATPRYGLAELAARACPTVREALDRMVKYAALVHPDTSFALEETADEARWSHRILGRPRGIGRHAHEYALASTLTHVRREFDRPVSALRVGFIHARPRELAALERFFGTRAIAFGCEHNVLALPRWVLDAPTRSPDARLLATADDLAAAVLRDRPARRDIVAWVADLVRDALPDGTSMDAIAERMRMSSRTLQRRLEEHGTSFTDVLDEVREARARQWVSDATIPLGEVAHRLGFADLATFTRAFRRWTAMPPGMFRRRERAE